MDVYSPDAVSNTLLDLAESEGKEICPLKLQKLLYFCHGWHLGLTGQPLQRELFEAWKYGPVLRSIYREFRRFRNDPITGRAVETQYIGPAHEGAGKIEQAIGRVRVFEPRLVDETVDLDTDFADGVIGRVWELYGDHSAVHLSRLTHENGTPWSQVMNAVEDREDPPPGLMIPDELMKDWFAANLLDQAVA